MRELARGAHDVSRGLAALRRYPELWKWLVAPAVLSLAVLVAVIATIVHFVTPLIASVEHHLPSVIASIAGTLLAIVVIAGLAMGGLLIFATLAGVVAGPFNERLSEQLEARLCGAAVPPFVLREFLHELARGAAHAVRRVIVAILGTVVVIALGFVPGIGTIAALSLGFLFAARALGLRLLRRGARAARDGVPRQARVSRRAPLSHLRSRCGDRRNVPSPWVEPDRAGARCSRRDGRDARAVMDGTPPR